MSLERMGAACAAAASARPWLVTALGVAALILALVPASRVGFDASVEGWFLPNDTTLERYQESRERFGHDEFLLVVLEPARGDVFQNEVLVPLSQLAARLDADSLVTRVHGIHNAVVIQAVADTIRVEPALGELPLEAEALDRARADLLSDPRAAGFLVAPDAAHAVLVVDLEAAGLPDRLAFAERVEHLAGEYRSASLRIHVMGDVVLHRDLYLKVQRDMRWVLPLLGLMLLVVLGVAFRSPLAVVLCLGVVGTSVVGARALMAALGWGDSPLLTLVPVVLVVTGVADAVHVLDRYLHARGADTEPAEAMRSVLRELFRPCLFTSLTTAAGFLALTASQLFPLRQLGVLAATGVGVAFVYSMLVLPAAVVAFRLRGHTEGTAVARVLRHLPSWIERRRRWVLAGCVLLTLLGLVGMLRLQVESRYLETFHAKDPVRQEAEWVEANAGGLASLEVLVASEVPGGVLEPAALALVDTLAAVLRGTSTVTETRALTDVLKLMNRAGHGGDPAAERVPEDPATAAQMLLLYEAVAGDAVYAFVDVDRTHARVWAQSRFASASEVDSTVAAFNRVQAPDGVTAELTGALLLFRRMSAYIVESQVRSFALALVAVSLFMALALRSWRLGLLSLVPNVWPLVLTLGLMGWVGWWLQPSTTMVAAIALGIGVDDSVHFLELYRSARARGLERPEAVAVMITRAGRAVTLTTVVLVLGFAVALLSALRESSLFAALSLIALFLAWLGDVLLLPALLLVGSASKRGH